MSADDKLTSDTLTREFASLLRAWPADSDELAVMARLLLLDGLAVALAGAGEPGPQLVGALARENACRPVASVIGSDLVTSPENAARINGMSMHVLDFEPMWNPANHALSPILPALLALGESLEGSGAPAQGARLQRALLKGIEAQGRLRLASQQIEPRDLTLHPPGLVGPIAAAIACADMLDLDEAATVAAIGIAASRVSGLMANVGSMTKALHCGDSAAHGLEAALMAARGFTADVDSLGSPRGFGAAYFGERFDRAPLLAPIVEPRVLNPGPAWKLFPSQYGTHFVITAALDCREEIGSAHDVEGIAAVAITTPVMPYIDRPRPRTGLDGKFSLQYCAAVALLDGDVRFPSFSDQRRFSPDIVALLDRITLSQTPDIPGRFDFMHVDVAVTLADGRQVTRRCKGPLGSWSRPVPPAHIEAKAHDLIDGVLKGAQSERLWQAMARPDGELRICELMQSLRLQPSQPN